MGFFHQDFLSYQSEDSIRQVAMSAFEEAMAVQKKIDALLHAMEKDYREGMVERLSILQESFEQLDGYGIQAQVDAVLEGIGFSTEELSRPLSSFSGGWRMRVMLAKLLLQKSSLLLLDEPTNHLDLTSIQWVENYLKNYPCAFVVVSHDRQFLDRVTHKTVEVTEGKLQTYIGNYSFYAKEKALREGLQQNAYLNQQKKIQQTQRFIERFRSKATKAKQVQSRVKSLEKIEQVEKPDDGKAVIHFRFHIQEQPGKVVASLEQVNKSFGKNCILQSAGAQVVRGDKIALIGANGKGKSTLLRIIAGQEATQTGNIQLGHRVALSFYAQHQLESQHLEHTILEELQQEDEQRTETELRTIAGMFLFTKDDIFKKVQVLSGGEKARVALAKVLLSNANFLLLDEPTNHLDILSMDRMVQALQQYRGTFVVVSHDRHFISKVANKIWYIEEKQIKEYPGTYAEYTEHTVM